MKITQEPVVNKNNNPIILELSREEAEDLLFVSNVYRDTIKDHSAYTKYSLEFNQLFNRSPRLVNFTEGLKDILDAKS